MFVVFGLRYLIVDGIVFVLVIEGGSVGMVQETIGSTGAENLT